MRVQADWQEGEEPIFFGNYGPYCPVCLKDENWLLPGKEDIESMAQNKRYRFYSEREQKKFKLNVKEYITHQSVQMPPPRVMFIGVRGSGLHTQLKKLNEKYKISVFNFKEEFVKQLKEEK